ncbi:unnamed protein product [Calypogeia fissa]
MSGQSFKDSCESHSAKLRDLSDYVKGKFWGISYVRNDFGEELPRALSFEECPYKADDTQDVHSPIVKREVDVGADGDRAQSGSHGDSQGLKASLGRLKDAFSDLSGDIVQSLQKF